MIKNKITKLKLKFNKQTSISQRDVARKWNADSQILSKIDIRARNKQRDSKYTEAKITKVKMQYHWRVRIYLTTSYVLDDESYFSFSRSHILGNDRFYTASINVVLYIVILGVKGYRNHGSNQVDLLLFKKFKRTI